MDNLTHTLFALTLARTPLRRAGAGTTATLVIASNVPDIDVLSAVGGTAAYLRWHRGPTHGLLGIVGLGALVGASVWILQRASRRSADHQAAAPLHLLLAIGIIGALGHVLMDLPTSYGTRLLSPFAWSWFAADWVPIVDIYLLALLAAGLAFGSRSDEARRRNAALVLALMAANYGLRAAAHRQALLDVPRAFGPLLPPSCDPAVSDRLAIDRWPRSRATTSVDQPGRRCLVQTVALPTFTSPFQWRVVAELADAYEIGDVDLFDARFRVPPQQAEVLWRTTVRLPNAWTPAVWTAATTDVGRRFLGFARLPAARSLVAPDGTTTVRWIDVRFTRGARGLAEMAGPNDQFAATVRINPGGRAIEGRVGP